MRKLKKIWWEGFYYLLDNYYDCDDVISFYTFFTIIFTQCAFLLGFFSTSISLPFTLILLGYVANVLILGKFKKNCEFTKLEMIFARLYILTFVILFLIGCFINIKLSIIVTILPFSITILEIRLVNKYRIQALPILAFSFCIGFIPIPLILKFVIPIIYAICIPFIVYIEDTYISNIFELAHIYWDSEFENVAKNFNKLSR